MFAVPCEKVVYAVDSRDHSYTNSTSVLEFYRVRVKLEE